MSENSLAFARSRISLVQNMAERLKANDADVVDDAGWIFYSSDDGFGAASWELADRKGRDPDHFRPEFDFDSVDGDAGFDVAAIQTRGGNFVEFKVTHQDIPAELVAKRMMGNPDAPEEIVVLTPEETEAFTLFMEAVFPED